MVNSTASKATTQSSQTAKRTRKRAFAELAIAYVLILSVIWSPRPVQRVLWIVAVLAVAIMMARTWDGRAALGLRPENFWRSMWVPIVALAIAGSVAAVSIHFHGLKLPLPPHSEIGGTGDTFGHIILLLRRYWAYALWTFVQQFLLQGFFLLRLLETMPSPKTAAFAAATLFALAHIPNPVLCITTLAWGFAACLVFLRYRNLYPLGIAHAIFGIMLAITIPAPIIRNMRVGLGYLTYGHRHSVLLPQPQGPDGIH